MLAAVATVCVTSLFWLIPGTNPNATTTPLWSVLISLVTSLGGMWVWKMWEARTPADEQFTVKGEDEGGGGEGEAEEGDRVPLLAA